MTETPVSLLRLEETIGALFHTDEGYPALLDYITAHYAETRQAKVALLENEEAHQAILTLVTEATQALRRNAEMNGARFQKIAERLETLETAVRAQHAAIHDRNQRIEQLADEFQVINRPIEDVQAERDVQQYGVTYRKGIWDEAAQAIRWTRVDPRSIG